jgi:hypothetical protein
MVVRRSNESHRAMHPIPLPSSPSPRPLPHGLAFKFGRGRVVVRGEAAALSARIYGSNPPTPMGIYVPGCDNPKLALHIVHWLSGLID